MGHKKNKKIGPLEWLGFKRKLDFSQARWLGSMIGAILMLILLVLIFTATMTLFAFLQAGLRLGPYANDNDGSAIRNVGLVLAALLGAPFVIWRAVVAAKQVAIADDSSFNDKIDTAVIALTSRRETTRIHEQNNLDVIITEWEDDLVARSAAIDRLESLVVEQNAIAPRVVKMLATYIRGNFSCSDLTPSDDLKIRNLPRMDLQHAIDAIGRIYKIAAKVDSSKWRLELTGCNFDGVNFSNGYFRATNFERCRFEAAIFDGGNFEGCLFYNSLLNYSDFRGSNFRGARLDHITLNKPTPVPGGFVSSINFAEFEGATFIASDISALDHIGSPLEISKTFATKDTVISRSLQAHMLPPNEHSRAHLCRQIKDAEKLNDADKERIRALESTGYQHWTPYEHTDMATGYLLKRFFQEMDMDDWPFRGKK